MDSATVSISFFSTYETANMGLDNSAYYKILNANGWNPLSYKEIANSLMKNGVKQMYHAIVNEDEKPDVSKLSKDRWKIFRIRDDDLIDVTNIYL